MNLNFSIPLPARVKWLNPTELFEQHRLPDMIGRMLETRALGFERKKKMKLVRPSSQPSHSLATAARGVLRPVAVASKLFAALCVLCVSAANLPAATVTNLMWDISGTIIDRPVKFYPQSTPASLTWNGTNVTVMDVQKTVTSTNGAWSQKFVGGFYYADFGTVNNGVKTPPLLFLVPPNDTNIYDFNYCANLATNLGTFFWTNSFYTVTNLAGNALVQVTNIAQSVGGGGAGTTNFLLSGVVNGATTNTAFSAAGAAQIASIAQTNGNPNAITNHDSRATYLTNAASSFAGSFSGNVASQSGETWFTANPNLFTNGVSVDCPNSDGLGGDNIFTVTANSSKFYDAGLGITSGENFITTNLSGCLFVVYSNNTANASWSTWKATTIAVSELSLGSSGNSRYGFNVTSGVNSFYYVWKVGGDGLFVGQQNIYALGKKISIGFTADGNYADGNIDFNGINLIKFDQGFGGIVFNAFNGQNFLTGNALGIYFGNGLGGSAASYSSNGTFYATFSGNGSALTNLQSTNLIGTVSIARLDTNTLYAQVGGVIAGSNYLTSVPLTATNWIQNSNNLIAMAGGKISGSNYLITIPVAATNQFLVSVPVGATNWLVDTNTAILWAGKAISGSNYLLTIPVATTNWIQNSALRTTNEIINMAGGAIALSNYWLALPANYNITNPNIALLNNQYLFVGGTNGGAAELIVTNNNPAAYVFIGAQADNGNGLTNYAGLWYNNSKFVPGSTWIGSTNDAGLEYNGAGNHFFDLIGAGSWLWAVKTATNSSAITNAIFSQSAFNFKLPTQVNGNAVLTNLTLSGDFGGNAVVSGQSATLALTNAAGFTNDVRAVVTNTPGNITTNGATALGQVPYFTNTLNGWGWYMPGAGTGGNVFSNTQSFFQSLIITNTLQVSNITPTQVLIGTNSISIGTNLTASSYILDVNSGSALGAAGAGLVARFTAGASSDLIISNDTTIARLYMGHAGLSGGAAAFVVEKLSGAADGYWGENADAGGYFFRGQGGFSFGGSNPAINIPSAGSGGGNIICTTNISLLGSEQISGTLKITNAVSVLANGSVSALYVASTNFLLMQTNYNNANWAPIPGQMKIICSNNWMFGVSDHSTNALFLIQP